MSRKVDWSPYSWIGRHFISKSYNGFDISAHRNRTSSSSVSQSVTGQSFIADKRPLKYYIKLCGSSFASQSSSCDHRTVITSCQFGKFIKRSIKSDCFSEGIDLHTDPNKYGKGKLERIFLANVFVCLTWKMNDEPIPTLTFVAKKLKLRRSKELR